LPTLHPLNIHLARTTPLLLTVVAAFGGRRRATKLRSNKNKDENPIVVQRWAARLFRFAEFFCDEDIEDHARGARDEHDATAH